MTSPEDSPPLHTLLYRYLFFDWLFKDVNCGNLFDRAAAWRHNQAHAHFLLTYLRRWCWCGALFYSLGVWVEVVMNAPLASAFFYVPGALSVPVNTVIGAAWLGLKVLQGPL